MPDTIAYLVHDSGTDYLCILQSATHKFERYEISRLTLSRLARETTQRLDQIAQTQSILS